jgi:hypothetical protein
MNDTPTGTFGQLPIGAVFRIPNTYQYKRKATDTTAVGLTTGATYKYLPHIDIRQDAYTGMMADRQAA